jgi:hypothetical protein
MSAVPVPQLETGYTRPAMVNSGRKVQALLELEAGAKGKLNGDRRPDRLRLAG